MHTLINGSQKKSNSNSRNFLECISNNLDEYSILDLIKDDYNEILESINKSSTIVLAFPLYVDSPNSLTLNFLDYIYDNSINLKRRKVYAIINCGFKEGEQNITALNVIKRWCKKVNAQYSGAILIGAGETLGNLKHKIIGNDLSKKLHKFSINVSCYKTFDELITTLRLVDNRLFCIIGNSFWNKKGRKNGLRRKDIIKK